MIQTIRTLLTVVAMTLLTIPSAGAAYPTTDSYQAQLYKVYAQEKTERPDKRQREHPAPILCHISVTDGIRIPGINVSEIESFEIYDTEGNCVAAYSSEQEFIDTLPTLHGEYQLCFVTDDFDLRGWIYLN